MSLPYKISTLVYLHNEAGDLLLLQRNKEPNRGLWSPIGGKLEMPTGESPFEAARRETFEEVGLQVGDHDLHLFCMFAEKNYEARTHWLMFLFDCRKPLQSLPPSIDEGTFAFHRQSEIMRLPIPETDRQSLWPIYFQHRHGFVSLRADCSPGQPLHIVTEQQMHP
ncbi:MAG: NUDIX domain-containing protein [Verrucomicrobiota bacterium JB022]|nr:NUDIX domain-containing protein [Verrucomicrobiota bacterium JB022]